MIVYLIASTIAFGLMTVMVNSTNNMGIAFKSVSFALTLFGLVMTLQQLGFIVKV